MARLKRRERDDRKRRGETRRRGKEEWRMGVYISSEGNEKETDSLSVSCDFSTLKYLCGKHWWVHSVAFTRAGPADRRPVINYYPSPSDGFHSALSDASPPSALSASAQRPAQGVCVRNREEGVWGGNLHLSPLWQVCVAMHVCVCQAVYFLFPPRFGQDSWREMIRVWDVWQI